VLIELFDAADMLAASTGTTTAAFTFDASITSVFCTAVLQLSVCGTVIATLEYPLYPIIVLSIESVGVTCSGTLVQIQTDISSPIVSFANLGISDITLTGTVTPNQLADGSTGSCSPVSNIVTNVGLGTHHAVMDLIALPNGTADTATFTVAIGCASLPYPNFTVTESVPA
jgi:hypothetical protein